jgi:hypothetical protein
VGPTQPLRAGLKNTMDRGQRGGGTTAENKIIRRKKTRNIGPRTE